MDEPTIHCLMMTVSEKGLPMHSAVVDIRDAPKLEKDGWRFVAIDPADQREYEFYLYERQFMRVRGRKRWFNGGVE